MMFYNKNKYAFIKSKLFLALGALVSIVVLSEPAFAVDVDDVAENMVASTSSLPGLVSAASYILGLLLGVLGILKLKDHVENPAQTPLRTPIIRFLIGGALFSLPMIYQAMETAINGGVDSLFDPSQFTFGGLLSGLLGSLGGLLGIGTPDINGILAAIIGGLERVPALISGISYLLALVIGVAGLLKIKDHVENPDQTPMREGIIRLLVGGALFALPTVFEAMATLITGSDGVGFWGQVTSILGSISWLTSGYGTGVCDPTGLSALAGGSVSSMLCNVVGKAGAAPAFLSALSYLFGLILGVWGILKTRDHVLNPSQTQVWEGVSRFLAGGAFFALPVTVEAIRSTVTPTGLTAWAVDPITDYNVANAGVCGGGSTILDGVGGLIGGPVGGWISGLDGDPAAGTGGGLDVMLYCAMSDIVGPLHSALNFFTFVAGIIFIMIGISRLIKSAQEGARGPGGIGTFMTFIAGGALISYNEFIRAFTGTFFTNPTTLTHAQLAYTEGAEDVEAHAHMVITAILQFMIIVGLISFVRGIFIIRNVSEGNGQASLMAGVTHLVGGSLAVNLGPLLNAVQSTLGISGYGIAFS